MLFYHVFSKKSGRIPELKELDTLNSLKLQFKNITNTFSSTDYLNDSKDVSPKDLFDELNNLIVQ